MLRVQAEFAGLVALSLVAPTALGDAPCYKINRTTTPAEQAQITSVLQSVQKALPPPPEGWIIVVDPANEISLPGSQCRDTEAVPWQYGFTRTYQQVGDAEERGKLLTDQTARLQAAMEERQPRIDAALQKHQKIYEQQTVLVQKGDYAGAEKLEPQAKAAMKEYEALLDEANDPAAAAATDKAFNKDRQMTITVSVNQLAESAGNGAKAVAPPAGAKSAQRWHVEDESQSVDKALYLFGAWTAAPQGQWKPATRAGLAPSAAHGISVLVTGDPARVTRTVASLDFAKFAAMAR
jgi:hypothetical protein